MNLCPRVLQTHENLFKFRIGFRNNGRKRKNIEINSEALISNKFHCVLYQWIRLDKLYKQMESFFYHFSNLHF